MTLYPIRFGYVMSQSQFRVRVIVCLWSKKGICEECWSADTISLVADLWETIYWKVMLSVEGVEVFTNNSALCFVTALVCHISVVLADAEMSSRGSIYLCCNHINCCCHLDLSLILGVKIFIPPHSCNHLEIQKYDRCACLTMWADCMGSSFSSQLEMENSQYKKWLTKRWFLECADWLWAGWCF